MPHSHTTSPEELHILQHSLGLDRYGEGHQHRNHFVTGPGSKDFDRCRTLVDAGYMQDHGPQSLAAGDHCFTVTPQGIDAVALQSPPRPKLTRSQQRYREYLASEANESFIEWLRHYCHG